MVVRTEEGSFGAVLTYIGRFSPLVGGVLCIIAWLGLLAGLFSGWNADDETSLVAAVILLGVTIIAALSSLPARRRATVVACAAAAVHGAVFTYLRVGFDRMMPDVVLYVLTALYYLSPLVAGVAGIVAWVGVRSGEGS